MKIKRSTSNPKRIGPGCPAFMRRRSSSHGGRNGAIQGVKETCHSTKRTHFIYATFSMYHICVQKLMSFAAAFANGFVLVKRTHFRVSMRGWGGYENGVVEKTNPKLPHTG